MFRKSLAKQGLKFAQDSSLVLLVECGDKHLKWLDDVSKDFHISCIQKGAGFQLEPLQSKCGRWFTGLASLNNHHKACRICRPEGEKAGKPLITLTPDGLLNKLRATMEEALSLATEIEGLIKALEGLSTIESRLAQVEKEAESYRDVVRGFAQ